MIRTNYDPEADVLHVRFGRDGARYDGAEEVVFLEFDTDGDPIGLEATSVRGGGGAGCREARSGIARKHSCPTNRST